ncbi:MAG: hypothetical protein ACLQVI_22015 [Polyangiaceae bacterium]
MAPATAANPTTAGGQFDLVADAGATFDFVVEVAPDPAPLALAAGLAAALEAMSTGHARTLATELRAVLEAMTPRGSVTSIADARAKRLAK